MSNKKVKILCSDRNVSLSVMISHMTESGHLSFCVTRRDFFL